MTKVIVTIILTLVTFGLRSTTGKLNRVTGIDQAAIMHSCNSTFPTTWEEFVALNETGTFIDETNKNPKCYLHCVLHGMSIVSEDGRTIDTARAGVALAMERNGKFMDDLAEMSSLCIYRPETCPCEISYQYMKCLTKMVIEKYDKPAKE